MSEILQPGQHPDADQLNAFVEDSLPLDERQQTLAHLATCSDCRAIVYLAHPADSTQPRPIARLKPWFSEWNLAWPAAAALACLAVLAVHLHNTGTARHETESIAAADLPLSAAHSPGEEIPSKSTSAQVEVPQAIVAPSPKTLGAEATTNPGDIDGFRKRKRLNSPLKIRRIEGIPKPVIATASAAALSQYPNRGSVSGASFQSASPAPAAPSTDGPLIASSAPGAAVNPGNAAPLQLRSASAGAAVQNNSRSFAALNSLGQKYHAASPATPLSPSVPPSAALAGNTSQTVVVADPVSIEAERNTSSTLIAGAAIGSLELSKSAKPQGRPVLPSQLPLLSTISNARQELAIDTAGTLFRSEDAGVTWHPVPAQWTGRAVTVSLAASLNQQMPAKDIITVTSPPVTARRTAEVAAQSVAFELTTDSKELWISTDGQTWMRK